MNGRLVNGNGENKMKNTMIALFFFSVAGICIADSWSVTVGTNSVVVAPSMESRILQVDGTYADLYTLANWSTGMTNSQGAYVKSDGKAYWTPNGGVSTNQPTFLRGVSTGTDGVTWVALNHRRSRSSLVICIDDPASEVYLNDNGDAVVNTGTKLSALIPGYDYGAFQGEVSGVASAEGKVLTVKQN